MQVSSLMSKLGRVTAPAGFEQRVMAELAERKRKRVRLRHLRLSFAGAGGALVVFAVLLAVFVLPSRSPVDFTGLEGDLTPEAGQDLLWRNQGIPIVESINYSEEMGGQNTPTIYILEQVSDQADTEIMF